MKKYQQIQQFEWDEGNKEKNKLKHGVTIEECESVFADHNKREYPDPQHSRQEIRKVIAGKTNGGRLLFVVYTIRDQKIRIISARDLSKNKEKELYI